MFRAGRLALKTIAIVAFVVAIVSTENAQATPDEGAQNKSNDPFREAIERRNREIGLRSITMIGSQKRDPREQQALLEQMNDDFKQIQLVRLAMVTDIANGKQFEYKRLADDASEIKKRAARLRSSLALLEDKEIERQEPKKVEYEKDSIQDAASDLCLEISRFITNPLFKPGAVYNLRYAIEADSALDNVINLSTNIKNSADKLRHPN